MAPNEIKQCNAPIVLNDKNEDLLLEAMISDDTSSAYTSVDIFSSNEISTLNFQFNMKGNLLSGDASEFEAPCSDQQLKNSIVKYYEPKGLIERVDAEGIHFDPVKMGHYRVQKSLEQLEKAFKKSPNDYVLDLHLAAFSREVEYYYQQLSAKQKELPENKALYFVFRIHLEGETPTAIFGSSLFKREGEAIIAHFVDHPQQLLHVEDKVSDYLPPVIKENLHYLLSRRYAVPVKSYDYLYAYALVHDGDYFLENESFASVLFHELFQSGEFKTIVTLQNHLKQKNPEERQPKRDLLAEYVHKALINSESGKKVPRSVEFILPGLSHRIYVSIDEILQGSVVSSFYNPQLERSVDSPQIEGKTKIGIEEVLLELIDLDVEIITPETINAIKDDALREKARAFYSSFYSLFDRRGVLEALSPSLKKGNLPYAINPQILEDDNPRGVLKRLAEIMLHLNQARDFIINWSGLDSSQLNDKHEVVIFGNSEGYKNRSHRSHESLIFFNLKNELKGPMMAHEYAHTIDPAVHVLGPRPDHWEFITEGFASMVEEKYAGHLKGDPAYREVFSQDIQKKKLDRKTTFYRASDEIHAAEEHRDYDFGQLIWRSVEDSMSDDDFKHFIQAYLTLGPETVSVQIIDELFKKHTGRTTLEWFDKTREDIDHIILAEHISTAGYRFNIHDAEASNRVYVEHTLRRWPHLGSHSLGLEYYFKRGPTLTDENTLAASLGVYYNVMFPSILPSVLCIGHDTQYLEPGVTIGAFSHFTDRFHPVPYAAAKVNLFNQSIMFAADLVTTTAFYIQIERTANQKDEDFSLLIGAHLGLGY